MLIRILDTQSAFNAVQNHPVTQNVSDTVRNGEVCDVDVGSYINMTLILLLTVTLPYSLIVPISHLLKDLCWRA